MESDYNHVPFSPPFGRLSIMDESGQGSPAEVAIGASSQRKSAKGSCELCRRMKIKCERQGRSCKHCALRNLDCTVTPKEKKRRILTRAEHVAALEGRIKRMEVVIDAAGLGAQLDKPESIVEEIGGQAGFSDRMSTLVMGGEGAFQFIGASSAFSFFSPRGLQWIKLKTRGHDNERLLKAIAESHHLWCDFATECFRSRPDVEQTPLPLKDVADDYVNIYFRLFNTMFPIYDEKDFRALYERQYSPSPPTSIAWYASLNIVLALGSAILQKRLDDAPRRSTIEDDFTRDISWPYFRNASSKFTDLLFMSGEIMSIQAILCMSFMLQTIPDPQPSYVLTAAAARLSHTIGLHRSLNEFGLDSTEKQQRQNVFWTTYMMDVGVSLRYGRPAATNDQDIAVALPQTKSTAFDHFRCMATLSLLESRVHSELYSAKAATRSAWERLKSIGKLDAEVTRWRDTLPLGYRPEGQLACSELELPPVIMMHFRYYNCLATIHRASIHHRSWTSDPDDKSSLSDHRDEKLNPRVYISSDLCLEAACNIISLLQEFSRIFPRHGLLFMATYYPLSATMTLFANILQNPRSTEALSNIELMGEVTTFMNHSAQFHKHLEGIVKVFTEFNRIAGLVVRDAQMAQLSELKRGPGEVSSADPRNTSDISSHGPQAQQFKFPDASDEAIQPAITYPDLAPFPFDQSQVYPTDDFYGTADWWTQSGAEDLPDQEYIWQI